MVNPDRITTDGSLRFTTGGVQRIIIIIPPPVVDQTSDTLLRISGFGVLLYQARGLSQTLEVIAEARSQERDGLGALIDISAEQFRKYISKITCTDSSSPPLDNVFPGLEVTVECACELCYLTGNPGSPAREVVPNTMRTMGNYTFYRPVLTMLVRGVSFQFDEWKSDIMWEIDLEEV